MLLLGSSSGVGRANVEMGLTVALTQIFFFILLGYSMRMFDKIRTMGSFNTAIGTLFLPAVLFVSMAVISLTIVFFKLNIQIKYYLGAGS